MVYPILTRLAAFVSVAFGAQLRRNESSAYKVEVGRGRCVDWGDGFRSCVTPRFDKTGHWMPPRPELTEEQRAMWQQRHQTDMRALSNAASSGGCANAVLLGDSITERWTRPSFSAKRAAKATCFNCGSAPKLHPGVMTFAIGGDRIQDLAWRLFEDGGIEFVQKCNPRDIVLMIGTNDYGFSEDVAAAEQELKLLVKQLQKAKPANSRLVLNAIFPRGDNIERSWGCPDWDPLRHKQLNSALENLAVHETSMFVDCSDIVNLTRQHAYEKDRLHLAKTGYVYWSNCLKRAGVSQILL